MKDEFYYKINNLLPSGEEMCDYGFSLDLDKEYAKLALKEKIGRKSQENLYKIANDIIKKLGMKEFNATPTYSFYEDTAFLTSCSVPGDRCTLGILGGEWDCFVKNPDSSYGNSLRYCTHNCDSTKQAYGLLSIWLFWADKLELFKKK